MKVIEDVKTEDEARQIAIDWQNSWGESKKSYGILITEQNYFEALADKFPELREEFKENAII